MLHENQQFIPSNKIKKAPSVHMIACGILDQIQGNSLLLPILHGVPTWAMPRNNQLKHQGYKKILVLLKYIDPC